jgi:hypothetical protein
MSDPRQAFETEGAPVGLPVANGQKTTLKVPVPLAPQYDGFGSCPAGNASPYEIVFENGYVYELTAVDPDSFTCGGNNDPSIFSCQKLIAAFIGDSAGPIWRMGVDLPTTIIPAP